MRARRSHAWPVVVLLALAGCAKSSAPSVDAGSDAGARDSGARDAGLDAGTDAAMPRDAGFDAGTDAGPCLGEGEACVGGVCHEGACCTGCWDGTSCIAGDGVTACGAGGIACAACDDGDPCTVDACEAGTCATTPVADFDPCATGGVCVTGNCAVLMHRPAEVMSHGVVMTSLGADMDGDGLADLAVMYRPRLAFGDPTWVVAYRGVDGTPLWTWTGPGWDETYEPEHPVVVVPDMDGDAVGDVLVGRGRDGIGRIGSLTWISGATGVAYRTAIGAFAGAYFGSSVSGGGDVDGDGVPDAAVYNPAYGDLPPSRRSAVIVSGATGMRLAETGLANLPSPPALGPDADGDGVADLVLADNGGTRLLSGATLAEVWSLPDERSASAWLGPDVDGDGLGDVASTDRAGVAHVRNGATGIERTSLDGVRIATLGPDADGDGLGELLVWFPTTGRLEVRRVVAAGTLTSAHSAGWTATIGPDADGDGFADVATGAAPPFQSEVVLLGSRGWARR